MNTQLRVLTCWLLTEPIHEPRNMYIARTNESIGKWSPLLYAYHTQFNHPTPASRSSRIYIYIYVYITISYAFPLQARPDSHKDAIRLALLREFAPEKYQDEIDAAASAGGWVVRPATLDQYSSMSPPATWRHPRTLTTLTWRCGFLDATFVTVPEGALSNKEIKDLNQELKGICHIHCTGRKSHMWDGQTTVTFLYDFLSVALAARRSALGLSWHDKASDPFLARDNKPSGSHHPYKRALTSHI